MYRVFCLITIVLMGFCVQGCAIAPFANSYSARTVGENHWSFQGGISEIAETVPFLQVGYGITENSEAGLIAECQGASCILGAYGKYALVNPSHDGMAYSFEGSVGGGDKVLYGYFGNLIGYKIDWYETVLITRLNYVKNNHHDSSYRWNQFNADPNKQEYYYLGLTLGNTFWVNLYLGLNVNINQLMGDVKRTYLGGGFIIKL